MVFSSRFARWLLVPIAVSFAVAMPADSAQAEPDPDEQTLQAKDDESASQRARQYFRDGQRMFAMGRFRQALASYQKAHKLFEHPDILFNIAQCYRNIGDYESAIANFRKYLDELPEADHRKAVLDLITKLEKEMANADRRRRNRVRRQPILNQKPTVSTERTHEGPSSPPIYKRWWFWAGVAAIAGGGTAYYLSSRDGELPGSDLGNIDFSE